jgi:transcriptional regulator with XRE-family HTH domain
MSKDLGLILRKLKGEGVLQADVAKALSITEGWLSKIKKGEAPLTSGFIQAFNAKYGSIEKIDEDLADKTVPINSTTTKTTKQGKDNIPANPYDLVIIEKERLVQEKEARRQDAEARLQKADQDKKELMEFMKECLNKMQPNFDELYTLGVATLSHLEAHTEHEAFREAGGKADVQKRILEGLNKKAGDYRKGLLKGRNQKGVSS